MVFLISLCSRPMIILIRIIQPEYLGLIICIFQNFSLHDRINPNLLPHIQHIIPPLAGHIGILRLHLSQVILRHLHTRIVLNLSRKDLPLHNIFRLLFSNSAGQSGGQTFPVKNHFVHIHGEGHRIPAGAFDHQLKFFSVLLCGTFAFHPEFGHSFKAQFRQIFFRQLQLFPCSLFCLSVFSGHGEIQLRRYLIRPGPVSVVIIHPVDRAAALLRPARDFQRLFLFFRFQSLYHVIGAGRFRIEKFIRALVQILLRHLHEIISGHFLQNDFPLHAAGSLYAVPRSLKGRGKDILTDGQRVAVPVIRYPDFRHGSQTDLLHGFFRQFDS